MKPKAYLHGECIIFQTSIPADASTENLPEKDFVIIADSETTGNHHVIDLPKQGKITFFNKDNKRFFKNEVSVSAKCVIDKRHHTVQIPPGEWGVIPQQEFDYLTMEKRAVQD